MKKLHVFFLLICSFRSLNSHEGASRLIPCAEAVVDVGESFGEITTEIAAEEAAEATEYLPQLAKSSKISGHLTNIGQAFGQGIIMAGGTLSQTIISQQDQQLLSVIQRNIQQTEQNFQATVAGIKSQGEKVIQKYSAQFNQQLSGLQTQYSSLAPRLISEISMILQLINLNIPPSSFIPSQIAIPNDVAFSSSTMNIPHQASWYNIYQVGDWEYDQATNTFYQRSLVPIACSPQCTLQTIQVAEYNHIFTERFLPASTFETITAQPEKNSLSTIIEMTIYNCTYPFFAGIMFNKTRWISGNLTRSLSYRLVGLYARDPKTAGIYTTQTTTSASTQDIAFTPPTTPLQKIIQQTIKPFYQFPVSTLQPPVIPQSNQCSLSPLLVPTTYFGGDPQTYYIRIITYGPKTSQGLQNIAYEITVALDQKFQNILSTYVAQNDDPLMDKILSIYHGIGFMAPGCQASFKILEVEELV